ncbi:uncharacterized protein LOC123561779 [Mercenaria mercenaria]|uniref:uncharacterized protein LOC123561779 n=1 Tax=Mercenaria mercenaria TaxID=6596 RepID=UPI00234E70F6|nr:uncharacterized protein LOC123561779 [Mercenaria mercenaria]
MRYPCNTEYSTSLIVDMIEVNSEGYKIRVSVVPKAAEDLNSSDTLPIKDFDNNLLQCHHTDLEHVVRLQLLPPDNIFPGDVTTRKRYTRGFLISPGCKFPELRVYVQWL